MNNYVRLFGIVPFGIGMTVLIFMWSQPFGGFHSPPLVFRFFASFIAVGFILVSGAIFFADPIGPKRIKNQLDKMQSELDFENPTANAVEQSHLMYQCSKCGAPLEDGAEVSPHGDVKCKHCGKWFNVHKAG